MVPFSESGSNASRPASCPARFHAGFRLGIAAASTLLAVAACTVATSHDAGDHGAAGKPTADDGGTDATKRGADAAAQSDPGATTSADAGAPGQTHEGPSDAASGGYTTNVGPPKDSDGDGFPDDADPAPADPTTPGDFSTPAAILSDPLVKTALAGARAAGYPVATHDEPTAPDVNGYYRNEDRSGHFVATGDGSDVGAPQIGSEIRLDEHGDSTVDVASVQYTSGTPISFQIARGELLRGTPIEITLYSKRKLVCTEAGSSFTTYSVGIQSATLDAATHGWKDVRSLTVTVATSGALTAECKSRLAGDSELVGGWAVAATPTISNVTPAALGYLCVDENAAYAPTEAWRRSTGATCECTTEYATRCGDT